MLFASLLLSSVVSGTLPRSRCWRKCREEVLPSHYARADMHRILISSDGRRAACIFGHRRVRAGQTAAAGMFGFRRTSTVLPRVSRRQAPRRAGTTDGSSTHLITEGTAGETDTLSFCRWTRSSTAMSAVCRTRRRTRWQSRAHSAMVRSLITEGSGSGSCLLADSGSYLSPAVATSDAAVSGSSLPQQPSAGLAVHACCSAHIT